MSYIIYNLIDYPNIYNRYENELNSRTRCLTFTRCGVVVIHLSA